MDIYIYIYMYLYICSYEYTCINISMYIYIYTYTHRPIYVESMRILCIRVHICIHICVYIYICTYILVYLSLLSHSLVPSLSTGQTIFFLCTSQSISRGSHPEDHKRAASDKTLITTEFRRLRTCDHAERIYGE